MICCLLNPEYVKRIMVVQNSFSGRGRYIKTPKDDPYENTSFCPECVIIQKSKKTKCVITFKQIISNKIYNYCIYFSRQCLSGQPCLSWAHSVYQPALNSEIYLLLPTSAGILGVCHHFLVQNFYLLLICSSYYISVHENLSRIQWQMFSFTFGKHLWRDYKGISLSKISNLKICVYNIYRRLSVLEGLWKILAECLSKQ